MISDFYEWNYIRFLKFDVLIEKRRSTDFISRFFYLEYIFPTITSMI